MKAFVILFSIALLPICTVAQTINFTLADPEPDLIDVYAGSFASGDIDGDGDMDLLITGLDPGRETALYFNDGFGNFAEEPITPFPDANASVTHFADLDGDEDLDLLFSGIGIGIQEFMHVYLNDGEGNFTQAVNPSLPPLSGYGVELTDIDGDDDLDIVVIGTEGNGDPIAEIFLNDGNASFSPAGESSLVQMEMAIIEGADIDNDEDNDLIVSGALINGNAATIIYLNDGEGNLSVDEEANLQDLNASDIDAADVDNDGDLDLLMSGPSDAFEILTLLLINDGEGNFTELSDTGIQDTFAGANAFADFDNDNDLDIVVIGSQAGGLPNIYNIVYENLGDNSFIPVDTLGGEYIAACAIADFNGDESPDIIIQGFVDNTNAYWNASEVTVSIDEVKGFTFDMFPNPAANEVTITLPEELLGCELIVHNMQGKLCHQRSNLSTINHTFQTDFPAGVYVCTLRSEDGLTLKRKLMVR